MPELHWGRYLIHKEGKERKKTGKGQEETESSRRRRVKRDASERRRRKLPQGRTRTVSTMSARKERFGPRGGEETAWLGRKVEERLNAYTLEKRWGA